MGFAAVDIGNTSIKVCIQAVGSEVVSTFNDVEDVARYIRQNAAGPVAFCTTRILSPSELNVISDSGWWELNHESRLPIEILYGTPETLGTDRLAGAIASCHRFKGRTVLVADVGTALTLDVVSSPGRFLGGNISPGIHMRMKALHHYTSRLPEVEALEESEAWLGEDTATAIQRGARWGVTFEIAGAYRLAERQYGCNAIVLTGGGAPLVCDELKEALQNEAEIIYVPNLVEEGLKIAYEFNHDRQI